MEHINTLCGQNVVFFMLQHVEHTGNATLRV